VADLPPGPAPSPASVGAYVAGVVVTVFAVLSQYFVPETLPAARILYDNLPGDLFVVYGVPILAFALLVGSAPLLHWKSRMGTAVWQGLRWYGGLALLALAVIIGLTIVYQAVDPSALKLLNRPNPALTQAQSDPWFFVGFSFVVGACEELIFRGWIFGYWTARSRSWVGPAGWTSAIFAGVHLYYGTTYGAAAPLIFPTLFLMGFAFAAAYRFSGGNLVVPALLHGANDAGAYLTLVSEAAGLLFHYLLIVAGGLIALIVWVQKESPPPTTALPFEPTSGPFSSPTRQGPG
jgi:membrane protease YdiL (CAAX protease family)